MAEIRFVGQEWLARITRKHLTFQITGLQLGTGARYPRQPSSRRGVTVRIGTNVFVGVSLLVVGCVDSGPVGFEVPAEADLSRTAAMEASGEPWAEVAASEIPGFAGFHLEDGSLVASASIARSANAARQYVANWQRENGYHGLPIRFREVEYDFLELSRLESTALETCD